MSDAANNPGTNNVSRPGGKKVGRSIAIIVGIAIGVMLGLAMLSDRAAADPLMEFRPTFTKLDRFNRPLFLTWADDGRDEVYIVEQSGRVWAFENRPDVTEKRLVLDIRDRVQAAGSGGNNEEGLLGLAFHPKFKDNRQVILYYSAGDPRRSVISRFLFDPESRKIDPDSEEVIMTVAQPWGNHNGGMIAFGPDGMLYIGLGDGGSGGDPQDNGENPATLLGSILRIDVDGASEGKNYAIPEDNPFADHPTARPEIWAYGLRNLWRFSFDRETGDLWAGDVGQNKWEEIDLIVRGGHYGWDFYEGNHPYEKAQQAPDDVIMPVVEHPRSEAISITGGYVYRGPTIKGAQGLYVYGDYGLSNVWLLRYADGKVAEHRKLGRVPAISSFGEDAAGEMYITSFDGRIYRLEPAR